MPIVNKPKVKQKKHGKKNNVRVSNKKAVKNGRAQPKPKVKAKPVAKPIKKYVPPTAPEPIESETEAEFDDTQYDGEDDFGADDLQDLDETEEEFITRSN